MFNLIYIYFLIVTLSKTLHFLKISDLPSKRATDYPLFQLISQL